MRSVLFCRRISLGIRSAVMNREISSIPEPLNWAGNRGEPGVSHTGALGFPHAYQGSASRGFSTKRAQAVACPSRPLRLALELAAGGELYARAEQLAIQKGDKRDQFYATCGLRRANIGARFHPTDFSGTDRNPERPYRSKRFLAEDSLPGHPRRHITRRSSRFGGPSLAGGSHSGTRIR